MFGCLAALADTIMEIGRHFLYSYRDSEKIGFSI